MNREFCLARVKYHRDESEQYKKDAEMALVCSAPSLKDEHFDYFMALSARHAQDAEDWMVKANGEWE